MGLSKSRFSTGTVPTLLIFLFVVELLVVWCNFRLYNAIGGREVFDSIGQGQEKKSRKLTSQAYVISFHQRDVFDTFRENNAFTGFFDGPISNETNSVHVESEVSTAWFPAVNGSEPTTLKEWDLTTHENFPKLKPEMGRKGWVNPARGNKPDHYFSPHVVGCYESHRRLLQLMSDAWGLKNGDSSNAPDALFVFEEDAICAHDTHRQIMDLIPKLPPEWDMLFIGGKPYNHFDKVNVSIPQEDLKPLIDEIKRRVPNGVPRKTFRRLACNGTFGVSATGPFGAPGDDKNMRSRSTFHPNQPYWKLLDILDSHAYVVNPKKIGRILKVLDDLKTKEKIVKKFRPIDVAWAEAFNRRADDERVINVYVPAKGDYCRQKKWNAEIGKSNHPQEPTPWEGYYEFDIGGEDMILWEQLYFSECPDSYANGLL